MNSDPVVALAHSRSIRIGVANAAWHGLLWLVIANSIGVLIAVLLLAPSLNNVLGEWSYGRWMIVHLNLELYGWTSLPMIGFLFTVYAVDREPFAAWRRPVLWVWSAALGVGALSWLSGHSSGKLFLDWSGYARIAFPMAMLTLWILLALSCAFDWNSSANRSIVSRGAKIIGLVILLTIPFMMYIASSPAVYPPVNPETGGPTGASQLESSLIIVAILLMLPFALTRCKIGHSRVIYMAWIMMAAESILCAALGRADIGHHHPAQYLALGSLVIWIPLIPFYYAAFDWHPNTRRWRIAFLCWWTTLVATGWVFFLPGILDHFKFTDGLVGHSFMSMAGFTSSLIIFVAVQQLGEDAWIFNQPFSFYLWHASVIAYIILMTVAGWREGFDPAFTIVPNLARNVIYVLRLVFGILMLAASLDWFIDASFLLREDTIGHARLGQETTA